MRTRYDDRTRTVYVLRPKMTEIPDETDGEVYRVMGDGTIALRLDVEPGVRLYTPHPVWVETGEVVLRQVDLTEEEVAALVGQYPEWSAGTRYLPRDVAAHGGALYRCVQAHTSQSGWAPGATPALWTEAAPAGVIREWKQPTGAHDAYQTGDRVTYKGTTYESLLDANVWSPEAYPAGWEAV